MGIVCDHDDKFIDSGDEGTSHCVYCRCLAAEADVVRLRKLEGSDDHPEHRCGRCGGRNTIWYADSDVWNRVAGNYSILCPICFCELGEEAGIAPTAWRLSLEGDDPEVSKLRVALHNRLEESAGVTREVVQLREALHDVQWKTICGGQGQSAYPTCVGCGIVSHGTLSTPPHKEDCPIETALRPKASEVAEAEPVQGATQ